MGKIRSSLEIFAFFSSDVDRRFGMEIDFFYASERHQKKMSTKKIIRYRVLLQERGQGLFSTRMYFICIIQLNINCSLLFRLGNRGERLKWSHDFRVVDCNSVFAPRLLKYFRLNRSVRFVIFDLTKNVESA